MEEQVKTWGKQWTDDKKLFSSIKDRSKYCPNCGHSIVFGNRANKVLCTYCNKYVFKNKEVEFKYRLKEQLLRKERQHDAN